MSTAKTQSKASRVRELRITSSKLIKEQGFVNFCRIAIQEFGRRKLSLFDPLPASDIPSIQMNQPAMDSIESFVPNEAYSIWLKRNILNPLKFDSSKKEILSFAYLPKMSLILSANSESGLTRSLDSIFCQSYENWELIICAERSQMFKIQAILDKYNDNRIRLCEVEDIRSGKVLDIALQLCSGDYFGVINLGDSLSPICLSEILKMLNKNNKLDIIYTDHDEFDSSGARVRPFFKPDLSIDFLYAMNYIRHFCLIRRAIVHDAGDFRPELQTHVAEYDMILKLLEGKCVVGHVPLPLYTFAEINQLHDKESNLGLVTVVRDALGRKHIDAQVDYDTMTGSVRIKYSLESEPKVSIIIPTKDQVDLLSRCIKSIENNTDYHNYEIIIIDNNSEKKETIAYLKSLPYKTICYTEPFNFSKMNNIAVGAATGDYFLFLNDDTAAIDKEWLKEMVSICQQTEIGAVGAKLVYDNNTIQHAGIVLLKSGSGFHPFQQLPSNSRGYHNFINVVRNYSAVTGACLMIRRNVFAAINGWDEEYDMYYGDSDICLRVWQAGYRVVYTPHAVLLHQGSQRIKKESDSFWDIENHYRFSNRWSSYLRKGDPFYTPNLGWDFRLELE